MSRYIDSDKLYKIFVNLCEDLGRVYEVDAVEVVRCRDCKYRHKEWYQDKRYKDGGYWIVWCDNDAIAELVYGLAKDNDYCSYGERLKNESK